MRKYTGASFVVLGIILMGCGLDTADSMELISRRFSTWPPDGQTCLLVGGILSLMMGLHLSSHRRKPAS